MTNEHLKPVHKLKEHLASIRDIDRAIAVLDWDQQTYMPPGGGRARADQVATLRRVVHEMLTSERTRELLAAAEQGLTRLDQDSDEAALVRVTRRDYDLATRLPPEFVAEHARTASVSLEVWRRARPANDFPLFEPHLDRMFGFARRAADYLGYRDHPYDALLDLYEPQVTSREVGDLFLQVREATIPLLQAIAQAPHQVDGSILEGEYVVDRQEAFAREVAEAFGYDFRRGRLDVGPHPFATHFSRDDVRIITRYNPRFLATGIFGILHEAGHAMYEQGTSASLERTPLASGTSLGMHESQSRMWENLVGRSRPFWQHYFPRLQAFFPDQLAGVDTDTFYRAVNRVEPSLIRVEADEVTYNLHIILRFELEKAMLEGTLRVDDLPEVWRAKMEEYVGVVPPTDADGVMQDIHWASGLIGYFPTYTLGNVISTQLFDAAQQANPALLEEIGRGRFGSLLGWLREHIHRHGRKFFARDLVKRATGSDLNAGSYLRYLFSKYEDIYGLPEGRGVEKVGR